MKQLVLFIALLLAFSLSFAQETDIEAFLKAQPEIKSVEKIEGNAFFTSTYKIMVEQQLDYNHPEKGTFLQRVFVADKAKEAPVVFITEGYTAGYAGSPRYINELSPMLNASQICVEHRYFGESWPKPLNWDYLTVKNAAADHHHIVLMMKKYYTGKWINTGISKGGQTVVYHRWLYPNDVDVSIPYVAPLNFGVEDGRHEPFIANVPGTPEQRKKILEFQTEILKNRSVYLPKLKALCEQQKFTFRISMDEVLDYCVLEYPFALWQWGNLADQVPAADQDPDTLFKHLMIVSNPSYFAIEGMDEIKSFFVQAARELGYYGYGTKPFKPYLKIKSAKNYLSKIFLPTDLQIKYNKKTAKHVKEFIDTTDARILFIYGGWDPWFATAFEIPEKDNFLNMVKAEGSHAARIGNLLPDQKKQVKEKLEEWLGIPVNIELD
ncbi:S28 family serine protease [Maribellus sp. YY47]|uniref:S28 family serine protease n=1 Tax=Maribellus sp. YY47 TaxID=2929486 RepID=UPI002000A7D8|nr:S28 family serine protease [Maribellus sp. YY47]MCK3683252.1 peptidase [Maribellus sp. YY47]